MLSLSETQALLRDSLIGASLDPPAALLVGGTNPAARLAIHRRHYHATLVEALRHRFPATAWLVGDRVVTEAARAFIVAQPPRVICMTEFGEAFPEYLASRPGLSGTPYLREFSALEWAVGTVSLAVDLPALPPDWLGTQPPDAIGGCSLALQPGLAWLRAGWAVDDLMQLYLTGSTPDQFHLDAGDYSIEVRGARGDVSLRRLAFGVVAFRQAIASGLSIEEAAGLALDADSAFDPAGGLVQLFVDGLVTGLRHANPHTCS